MLPMIKNYFVTAVRNILRQKNTATINVAGLTLGIASALILIFLVGYHFSFDTFHSRKDRIYRVVTESNGNNGKDYSAGIPSVLPEAFGVDFPEAENVTFISYRAGGLVTIVREGGVPTKFEEPRGIAYTQPDFFKIFDRDILIGSAEKGLDEPNEAILSRSWAIKYFGREDAVGQVLRYDNRDYRVAAIMEDAPVNTDVPLSLMLSYVTVKKELDEHGWHSIWSDEHCYFTLKEGESLQAMESRMPAFVKKYLGDDNPSNMTYAFQPLKEVHFDDRYGNFNYNTVSRQTLFMMAVLAIFLLVTACINFVNLSTAEAIKRSKEVAIRKSLGSSRQQLIRQFLGETFLTTLTSTILALGLVELSLGFLNSYLNVSVTLSLSDPLILTVLIGIVVITSLLSGLYPAFIVSSYQPALALKNKAGDRQSSSFVLRRMLVVFQFFISQFLIIGTIIFVSQMNFFQNKDLGFRKDAILTVPIPVNEEGPQADTSRMSRMRTLRQQIEGLSNVEIASLCNTPPSSGSVSGTRFALEGDERFFETQVKTVDANYIPLFGLQLSGGRNLEDLDTARGFVVNEKLAAMAGFNPPADIIGKRITMWRKTLPVVGVVRDFHTVSLHSPIEPTILLNRIRSYRSLSVGIRPENMQGAISEIKRLWESAYPEYVFSYEFLDESVREFYENERRTSGLLSVFTGLAIFIGCLGLFGLASFMANQKAKEIGIRKVLGASVENILLLFSKEFVVLIVIGFVLAAPVSWTVMRSYLSEFTYRISIEPWMFLGGLLMTLLVAMLTVGYRSARAAIVNPVNSLRSE